jgi:hypothetical protein
LSGAEFCVAHGITPDHRILLYAGSSKGSDEFEHLRFLEAAIDRGEFGKTAIVYRPHPWGNGGLNGARILDHPWRHVRIESTMRDYLERVKQGYDGIYAADYRNTHDVLSNIDVIVSPLSTIILEAALQGKPSLCFFPDDDPTGTYRQVRRLIHFEEMFEMPEFPVAYGTAQLVQGVSRLLALVGDQAFSRRLQQRSARFVTPFVEPWGQRLLDFVETCARPKTTVEALASEGPLRRRRYGHRDIGSDQSPRAAVER